ncbi:type II toxin-antitoxin system RelE/ParE family toxin [Streptomyces sp. DH8]|uniref:type II toxin-antitoxin system RelE family toxin n=1 Tax=Streptomyces sp. DH8 TaxID=2857008 RepID=UPI001E4A8C19|nr:hypothetical protein [Streptomyces sp. DH8]
MTPRSSGRGGYRVASRVEDGEPVVLVVEVGDRRDVHRSLRAAGRPRSSPASLCA